MTTGDKFVSIQPKRIMGFLDFRDRFLDFIRAQYSDLVAEIFGDDGTFGSSIGMSEFGSGVDRVQLDSTSLKGSDGNGALLIPDAELSGQDVGLQFENIDDTIYFVGQHLALRPRGIQINPRTGFPEFLEFEETIGLRDDPSPSMGVTDNGDGTITFRVNTVGRPFAADVGVDQTGRQVLVWKKTPGRLAITEALAVEQLTIVENGGNLEVTSVGNFGQTTVSTNTSDYFVLLLGPVISLLLPARLNPLH